MVGYFKFKVNGEPISSIKTLLMIQLSSIRFIALFNHDIQIRFKITKTDRM